MGDLHLETQPIGADGRYQITICEEWKIWGPNGGYMAAIALRAAGMEAQIRRPVSISCHFLSMAKFELADLEVRTVFRGKRTESFHVTMTQGEKAILHAMVRTASEAPGIEHNYAPMPDVPSPDVLQSYHEIFADEPGPPFPFWNNIEGKPLDPVKAKDEMTPRDPLASDWHRFQPTAVFDDPFTEAARSLVLIDTLSWPAASMPHRPRLYMAPNMDVVAYFYEQAADEWLLSEHTSVIARGGLVDTSGRVWSRDGRLVATGSAQLMCLPAPPEGPR